MFTFHSIHKFDTTTALPQHYPRRRNTEVFNKSDLIRENILEGAVTISMWQYFIEPD